LYPEAAADIVVARYADREIEESRTAASMCAVIAMRAQSQGRRLVAGVLYDLVPEFDDEASFLTSLARPEIRWPLRDAPSIGGVDLDDDLDTFVATLQHSERVLRWIAQRPDLPRPAMAVFASMAAARRARYRLLTACRAVDSL
jgi:hypothetical protein